MTKTTTLAVALAAMASLTALAAVPQSAQALGRGIAVGEPTPGRGRFHDGGFRRIHFFHFGRFGGFGHRHWF